MITSRTPLRVSFAGGGSDLPAFCDEETGAVVTTAIRQCVYVTVSGRTDSRICIGGPGAEDVAAVEDVRHELTREALRTASVAGGLDIVSTCDVPWHGTGLGSSSSYTVGLLAALYRYARRDAAPERLARDACQVEIERCGKPIGRQDQYIAAFGGLQYLRFHPDRSVTVEPVPCTRATREAIESHLLLLYTGIRRTADPILAEQQRGLSGPNGKRDMLRRMARLADDLRRALASGESGILGEVLHEGWMLKRTMAAGVSTARIDRWYECARAHGATGGKLTGAGGGGFLLLYAPPDAHAAICRALPSLHRVAFGMDGEGATIIGAGGGRS
jgi:D-glycero-alpha-D-manno-heptose-7-phosphate kinase